MPPGIGDAVLDLIRLVKNIEFIIVTTSSRLAFETVKKLANLLEELQVPVIGVMENMKMNKKGDIEDKTRQLSFPYLGEIQFDPNVETAIGKPSRLLNTAIGQQMKRVVEFIN
jgi:ATP-binding protein involved in chromosome partitioning